MRSHAGTSNGQVRMATGPRARRRVAAVLLAGAAVTTLVGCSARPGVAAVVDDRTITQDDVSATQQDLRVLIPDLDAGSVVSAMVAAPYYIDAAAQNGVGVSSEEAREFLELNLDARQAEDAASGAPAEMGDGAVEVIRFTLAAQNIETLPDAQQILQGVSEQIGEADLEINPRYGELDAFGEIVPIALPWLVPAS